MQQSSKDAIETEVVVIGAGYSGIAAALRLHDLGIDAVVLEAADRVGGRIWSEQRGELAVDHGGQWVGPTQKHILALAERFDCTIFPSFDGGQHRDIWCDGSAEHYRGSAPASGPGIDEYNRVTALLDTMSRQVDLEQPWLTTEFAAWDAQSAQDFFEAETSDSDAHLRLALFVQGLWCAEPQQISLFHVLFYLAAASGYDQLMDTEGGAQESRFRDGAAAPVRAAAELLGDRIRLSDPVSRIDYTADGVTVTTSSATVHARRAVVTVAPTVLSTIEFSPALPAARQGWATGNSIGQVAKIHAFYPEPFWRADGLAGIATLYDAGPVGVVFDNSPADGGRGVLVGFVYGDRVEQWAAGDDATRRAAILQSLSSIVGPRALAPSDYTEMDWSTDPYARGGYEAYATPGTWSRHGREGWRAPTASLHWAGTETASCWNGYMDGAISAGYRAADEAANCVEVGLRVRAVAQ